MDHISTSAPYLSPRNISGATYPGVPHATSLASNSEIFLAKPKSAILIFASLSSVMGEVGGERAQCRKIERGGVQEERGRGKKEGKC